MKLGPRLVRLMTTITEYQCDDCKEGLMARDKGYDSIQLTNPPKLKHKCTQCESVDWFSDDYTLFKNTYTSVDETSASDAERITQLEQTILNMGKQIERLSQDVQSAKSGWL
ncbi:TPA: hypothetical protein ACXNIS_003064 [Providencia rettgeri]|uniref:hypothetical protein n=1 Tax=Providencia rettgeri TaxID=587 RepID=UPI001BACC83A|nr:hypothetical protein [Providencia rettgeri]MBS0916188.1 hypothetical protein [Providencia rettgeri]